MSAGKGSDTRGSQEAYVSGSVWCEECGRMRGGGCMCSWRLPQKDTSTCGMCGRVLRMDDTVAWGGDVKAMCVQCYFKRVR